MSCEVKKESRLLTSSNSEVTHACEPETGIRPIVHTYSQTEIWMIQRWYIRSDQHTYTHTHTHTHTHIQIQIKAIKVDSKYNTSNGIHSPQYL